MSCGVYKGEDRSFPVEFDHLMYFNIKLTTEGFQREKAEPICARGRLSGQDVWPAGHSSAPKIFGFSQNSLINHSTHSYP
jgi:hypothetical protein